VYSFAKETFRIVAKVHYNNTVKAQNVMAEISKYLLEGYSEIEVMGYGFNPGTVRVVAFNLEKAGKRYRHDIRPYTRKTGESNNG